MRVLRITHRGGTFIHWVPPLSVWEKRDGASSHPTIVERMKWTEDPSGNGLEAIREYMHNHPDAIIQYEGKPSLMPDVTQNVKQICVMRHLTQLPKKDVFHRVVVPSFFARETLRRKGYKVTMVPPFVPTRTCCPDHCEKRPLTVLLHPGAVTLRLLRAITQLSDHRLKLEWLVLNQGSKRVPLIDEALRQSGLNGHSVRIEEENSWQRAHVMVTDQHPVYSLNALHSCAFTYGIPVLTTAIGDHPELVKHRYNGFLLSPSPKRLSQELAQYMLRFMREPTLIKQLRENGHHLHDAYYSPLQIRLTWQNLYDSLWRNVN